jgi:hypothetical protein
MPFTFADYNYNYKIQKVARDVMMGTSTGQDPMDVFIKAAQKEQLTPQVIESAVHYLNNELFLDHMTKKASGNPKLLKVKDVLDALSIPSTEKTASDVFKGTVDYWDITPKKSIELEKTASIEDTQVFDNIKTSEAKRKSYQETAQKKFDQTRLYDSIVKLASDSRQLKERIYNETLLSLKRAEITPEEVKFLSKVAGDLDMEEVYIKVLGASRMKVNEKGYLDVAQKVADGKVTYDTPLFKNLNQFLNLKEVINQKIQQYNQNGEN